MRHALGVALVMAVWCGAAGAAAGPEAAFAPGQIRALELRPAPSGTLAVYRVQGSAAEVVAPRGTALLVRARTLGEAQLQVFHVDRAALLAAASPAELGELLAAATAGAPAEDLALRVEPPPAPPRAGRGGRAAAAKNVSGLSRAELQGALVAIGRERKRLGQVREASQREMLAGAPAPKAQDRRKEWDPAGDGRFVPPLDEVLVALTPPRRNVAALVAGARLEGYRSVLESELARLR